MPGKRPGKSTRQSARPDRLRPWLASHSRVARASAHRLLEQPVSSLLTVFVIAVSLLLPALLFALNGNLRSLLAEFQAETQISLYLQDDVTDSEGSRISNDLLTRPDINTVNYLTRDDALAEFSAASGLGSVLSQLTDNPLPATILVTPAESDPAAVATLAAELESLPAVELVHVDSQWLQRLAALSNLIATVGSGLSLIVVLGLMVIVGNTIKLAIENRRTEISVLKLVGGTDSFIARPFLYSGLLYGAAGGLLAAVLQLVVLAVFNGPLQELLVLYDSSFRLTGFSFSGTLELILVGGAIGWIAAVFASYRHIWGMAP